MNRRTHIERTLPGRPASQRGAALVISLVLLVIITLVGLASIRSTQLQERMSGNMYDRSLAFQRAESALRAAESAINVTTNITTLGGVDCRPATGTLCSPVPSTTFADNNTNWTSVASTYDVNGAKTPGDPQYHIQFMGTGPSTSSFDTKSNANEIDYSAGGGADDVAYYRVTVRSSNPQVAQAAGDRSIVVLQSTVKRPL